MATSIIASAVLALAVTTGVCANIAVQLNVISQNESIDLYDLTLTGHVSKLFSAQLDLPLWPPCPSCHSSYNFILFDEKIIIPATGMVMIFSFTFNQPYVYTQSVSLPHCEPLSMVRSSQNFNQLFLDCKDLADSGNYFLAELELMSAGTDREQWTFRKFNTLVQRPGTFVEVSALGSVMMLYAHQSSSFIKISGFLSGYINQLPLPDSCSRVVKLTATSGALLLLECSSDTTELVTNFHLLVMDSMSSTHLFDTAPYAVCPIRFTPDEKFAAVFTEHYVIIIDLVSHVFTNISVNQAIYDGVITQSENDSLLYAVYTTQSGLHRVLLSIERDKEMKVTSQLLFPDTGTVCALTNCPLLTLVDSDTVIATLDLDITIFSISRLSKIAPNVRTIYQPSRIMFQKKDGHSLTPVTTHSSLSLTDTMKTLTHRPQETTKPSKEGYDIQDTQENRKTLIALVVVVVLIVIVSVVIVVAVIIACGVKKLHQKRKVHVKARYISSRRGSDAVHLISNDTLLYNHKQDNEIEVELTLKGLVEAELMSNNDETCQEVTRTELEKEQDREREERTQNQRYHPQTLLQQVPPEDNEGESEEEEGDDSQLIVSCKDSPTAESQPASWCSSMAVYAQETNFGARFSEQQQQVVGSFVKETREVRESPDGCNSS